MFNANELISFKIFFRNFRDECFRVSNILSKSERIVPFKKLARCDSFELSFFSRNNRTYILATGDVNDGDNINDVVVTMFPYHYLSLSDGELQEKVKLFDEYAKQGRYIDEISEC